jgi:S-adenosylmethionine:diacylglycerol 3-amino-3-carboxypropyl transferase
VTATPWESGRFDARKGPGKVLFGRMYEDPSVELSAFPAGARVFCIASAGCTAMKLAPRHEVVAADINPVQLSYAERRFRGEPAVRGTAERIMDLGRAVAPVLGWNRETVRAFLDLDDPKEQLAFWRSRLDTLRFRTAFDSLLSISALRAFYATEFLAFLPSRLGAVMRARMERCIARHPNRGNPHARALLLGEFEGDAPPPEAASVRLVQSDAAEFLEKQPAGSFGAFTVSNILDGAGAAYRARLFAAVKHAAAPGAMFVLRSFGEPAPGLQTNRAEDDRSMLWGVVDVRPAAEL